MLALKTLHPETGIVGMGRWVPAPPMPLNIKSAEADRLVEALSNLTGESKTQAVIQTLRERLARAQREQDRTRLSADLLAIGRRCAGYGRHNVTDHGELLYDERVLPR